MRPEHSSPQVLVVMGVSGCGKSTVAGLLAGGLGWDLAEGDDMHSAENVDKMRQGRPLSDEDRVPWLSTVSSWIVEHLLAGVPGVITCSALKRSYRDVLRAPGVVFVHLAGPTETISARLTARLDHFMPSTLLDSQMMTLEAPGADETALEIDIRQKPKSQAQEVMRILGL